MVKIELTIITLHFHQRTYSKLFVLLEYLIGCLVIVGSMHLYSVMSNYLLCLATYKVAITPPYYSANVINLSALKA